MWSFEIFENQLTGQEATDLHESAQLEIVTLQVISQCDSDE
jgi:hypothetical protein